MEALLLPDGLADLAPMEACISCAHVVQLAAWVQDAESGRCYGVCRACLDLAAPNRGGCSAERGCQCHKPQTWQEKAVRPVDPVLAFLCEAREDAGPNGHLAVMRAVDALLERREKQIAGRVASEEPRP